MEHLHSVKKGPGQRPQYSLDNGETWVTLEINKDTPTVAAGSKILWRAEILPYGNDDGVGIFSSTGKFNVEGNPLSLIFGDDFEDKTDLAIIKDSTGYTLNCTFFFIFYKCKVVSAKNLSLPATTLVNSCYSRMFYECTSLVEPPKLLATTLAEYCYHSMFYGCTALQKAPKLHATTLAKSCYGSMFKDCTSLVIPPALPATTLPNYCYSGMFQGCKNLITAPDLPAPTLQTECYYQMFYGCTNLNYIKCLATNIRATNCTYNWVSGVASTGTFVKDASMTGWTRGVSKIPNNWTIEDA